MSLEERACIHAALGDVNRLRIVDELAFSDRTVAELGRLVDMRGNLLAHHLEVLESASLIERHVSEGDRRRRYVSLRWDRLPLVPTAGIHLPESVVFVCTHNSARSQYAAALWSERTGSEALSAGSDPAARVHPAAVRVAGERGIDLSGAVPGGYDRIETTPALVVSVCDRAREGGVPAGRRQLHWSVPDPVPVGRLAAFRSAFDQIEARVDRLVRSAGARR